MTELKLSMKVEDEAKIEDKLRDTLSQEDFSEVRKVMSELKKQSSEILK